MITFEEAREIVLNSAYKLENESVELKNSLKRILAANVISDMNMPPFDKSAMDGYACKKADITETLEVIEIIPAGYFPTKRIEKNQCAKIMTGAMLPQDADCVIMVEDTEILDKNHIRCTLSETALKNFITKSRGIPNVCLKGEDIKQGEIVLKKGILINPQHIAILASAGCAFPIVAKQPRIAVIATGNELIEANKIPDSTQIRNSNGPQLVAQLANMNVIANYYGIAPDTEPETNFLIEKAITENDIVLLTGGVSMGDFDLVPAILKQRGFNLLFDKILVQPGKPTTFGTKNNKFCFGLPGNPVSSFMQFELLVKPLIYSLMGYNFSPPILKLPLGKAYSRKKSDRLAWLPIQINRQGKVIPIEYHGSAHINALGIADGIISIPIGQTHLVEGDLVDVRQI